MDTTDPVSVKLVATMRRLQPVKVAVYDASDERRDIAVPTRRTKWNQVIAAIEARPWVRCELLDKSGAVLGYVDNDGPASSPEDISGSTSTSPLAIERYMRIMLDGQKQALTFRDREHQALLSAIGDVLKVVTDAMRQTSEMYRAQVEAIAELSAMQAEQQQDDAIEKAIKVLENLPDAGGKLLPFLAGLRGVITGKLRLESTTPPSPPNGAK